MKGNYSYAECPNSLLNTTYLFLSVRLRESVSSFTAESEKSELPRRAKLFRKTTPGQNQNKMVRIHGTY